MPYSNIVFVEAYGKKIWNCKPETVLYHSEQEPMVYTYLNTIHYIFAIVFLP